MKFDPASSFNLNRSIVSDCNTVLLIDDDAVTRWQVRVALKGQCTLLTAPDVMQAISCFEEYAPDLVLLDIGLPDGDGRDLLKHLLVINPDAHIVMLSSRADEYTIDLTHNLGAEGFIPKPFDKQDLINFLPDNGFHG